MALLQPLPAWSPKLLSVLVDLGVLDRYADRHEIDWYLTPLGKAVLEDLQARVSEEDEDRVLGATKAWRR